MAIKLEGELGGAIYTVKEILMCDLKALPEV